MIDENSWHLDKKVPIATITAIAIQAAALGWMASSMDGRINALENYATELRVARLRERMAIVETTAAEANTKFEHIDGQLDKLDDKLDRIADRVGAKK